MKLPYVRRVNYLSWSALRQIEEDPLGFYVRRLGPEDRKDLEPREETFPAAVGLAFDALVKESVAGMTGVPVQTFDEGAKKVKFRSAWGVAGKLLAHYQKTGAFGNLLLQGPQGLEVRVDGMIDGVPVRAQIDCVLRGGIPLDWKTASANRPGKTSPAKGYQLCYDSREPGKPKTHEKAGLLMEEIDEDWAAQLVLNAELLGTADGLVAVDQLIVCEGYCRVAQYRTAVSGTFREKVKARLRDAWARITEEKVVDEGMSLEELRALR